MGDTQLQVIVEDGKIAKSPGQTASITTPSTVTQKVNYNWWLRISTYVIFVLAGQSAATVLGRLYFVEGGSSKWMGTLVQIGGFPILIPLYFITKRKFPSANYDTNCATNPPPSALKLGTIYVAIGLLITANCFLYAIGTQNLPVSTFTLICSSQLVFTSFFSFFLNSQKFTPLIINSLFLLIISSVLLVLNNESANPGGVSKMKYFIGFICTVGASAGYGLLLSLTQFAFRKIIRRQTFRAVMDMIICQSSVATAAILVGLFASGEWEHLTREMNDYRLGKVSYVMSIIWTSILWQLSAIGSVGLIFEVSSLFSNAIGVLGLPIVPILALFVFHDKMNGVKGISLVLAVWGFLSYVYQHYLDDQKSKQAQDKNDK